MRKLAKNIWNHHQFVPWLARIFGFAVIVGLVFLLLPHLMTVGVLIVIISFLILALIIGFRYRKYFHLLWYISLGALLFLLALLIHPGTAAPDPKSLLLTISFSLIALGFAAHAFNSGESIENSLTEIKNSMRNIENNKIKFRTLPEAERKIKMAETEIKGNIAYEAYGEWINDLRSELKEIRKKCDSIEGIESLKLKLETITAETQLVNSYADFLKSLYSDMLGGLAGIKKVT